VCPIDLWRSGRLGPFGRAVIRRPIAKQLLDQRRETIDLILGRRLVWAGLDGRGHVHRHRGRRTTALVARPLAAGPSSHPPTTPTTTLPIGALCTGPGRARSGRGGWILRWKRRPWRRQGAPTPSGHARPLARAIDAARVQQAADQARTGHEHAVRPNVADDPIEVAAT
jgi:hypothetical protein